MRALAKLRVLLFLLWTWIIITSCHLIQNQPQTRVKQLCIPNTPHQHMNEFFYIFFLVSFTYTWGIIIHACFATTILRVLGDYYYYYYIYILSCLLFIQVYIGYTILTSYEDDVECKSHWIQNMGMVSACLDFVSQPHWRAIVTVLMLIVSNNYLNYLQELHAISTSKIWQCLIFRWSNYKNECWF